MPAIEVDLLSDTVTRPTRAMRQFMCAVVVGDEQTFEDPTVNTLQEMAAERSARKPLCFARTKSAFKMNNIQRADVTFHVLRIDEITVRQAQVEKRACRRRPTGGS
jgi:hypothetical protein